MKREPEERKPQSIINLDEDEKEDTNIKSAPPQPQLPWTTNVTATPPAKDLASELARLSLNMPSVPMNNAPLANLPDPFAALTVPKTQPSNEIATAISEHMRMVILH